MWEQYIYGNGEAILWNKADIQRENRNRVVKKINDAIEETCERGGTSLTVKKDGLPKGLLEELKKNFDVLGEIEGKIIIYWGEKNKN